MEMCMYCPECGNDAEEAKFCPECGADLRRLGSDPVCADCGSEIPDGAKFCPECGQATGVTRTADAPEAMTEPEAAAGAAAGTVRRTGKRGRSAGASSQQQRRQQPRPQQKDRPQPAGTKSAAGSPKRLSPAVIWGGFGAAAVIVILVVVFVTSGGGGSPAPAATTGTQSVKPVSADTSGSYNDLVQRANGLYDQGATAFDAEKFDQGSAYFAAAAKVYAAAWKLQSTEPGVGTDFATSLFYSGQIEPALSQIERVLAKSPEFQTAWFNKGNYLAEKARLAEQDGNAKVAKAAYADARVAYEKAVALGADTPSGQQAQQRLDALPQ
jgi:hypothetical protein